MEVSFFFSSVFSILGLAAGLKCMTCQDASSFEECDVTGKLEECRINQKSCETFVRRNEYRLTITKGCKDANACRSNYMQNVGTSGKSSQCNSDQSNSVCCCCCDEDLCNAGAPTCVPYYQHNGPVNDCPAMPQNFQHGNIECFNGNKVGAVCEYQCTDEEYSVWPPTRNNNVCQTNGTWAHEQPCCARPCPPYWLFDDVFVLHYSGEGAEGAVSFVKETLIYGKVAEDAIKISMINFASEPVESSAIRFNDYESDVVRLQQLLNERIQVLPEGPVNVVPALRYALDTLLTTEAGMRDSRVPKVLSFFMNRSPDDDIEELRIIGDEARSRLFALVVFIVVTDDGYEFNEKKILALAGEKHRIVRLNHLLFSDAELSAQLDGFTTFLCRDPCLHVLRDQS